MIFLVGNTLGWYSWDLNWPGEGIHWIFTKTSHALSMLDIAHTMYV